MTTVIKNKSDINKLRRIALAAQGLLQAKPFGQGKAGIVNAINHIGYVQLDTISVVQRAHHHVLRSRIPGFQPEQTNELLNKGDIFEYWAHAAAFLPIKNFRFSLPYKNAVKNGKVHWYKDADKKLMTELLKRIRNDGPLKARDVESKRQNNSGWWDWKPAKKALEQLYMQGDIMVCDRAGFQKTYDLTENVLPSGINTLTPSVEEFAEHLLKQQIRSQGVFTLKGITYLRRDALLRKAVKQKVDERLAQGSLMQIEVESGINLFVETETFESPMPRVSDRLSILSPLDNSVIQRDRLSALFGFDYQLECYVPQAKRRYGYFSLPLLFRDQFIGRMDCKAHRKLEQLEIKSLHLEQHSFDNDLVVEVFAKAIQAFCVFQQCTSVQLSPSLSATLKQKLQRAIANCE